MNKTDIILCFSCFFIDVSWNNLLKSLDSSSTNINKTYETRGREHRWMEEKRCQ